MSSMNLRFMRSTTSISRYLSSRACCPCPSPDLVAVVHVASLVFIQFGGGLGVWSTAASAAARAAASAAPAFTFASAAVTAAVVLGLVRVLLHCACVGS